MSKDADKAIVPPFVLDFGDGTTLTLEPKFEGDFLSMFNDVPEGTSEEQARFSYAYNLFQAISLMVVSDALSDEAEDEEGPTDTPA